MKRSLTVYLIFVLTLIPICRTAAIVETQSNMNLKEDFQSWVPGESFAPWWLSTIASGNTANPNVKEMTVVEEKEKNRYLKIAPCGGVQYHVPENRSYRNGRLIFSFDIMRDSYDIETKICMTYKTKRGAASNLIFDTNHTIRTTYGENGVNVVKNVMQYNLNQWYKVRIEADTKTNLFDLYIDGVKQQSELPLPPYSWQNTKGFELDYAKGGTGFKVESYVKAYNAQKGGTYLDNFAYYSESETGEELYPEKIIDFDSMGELPDFPGLKQYEGIHPRLLMDKSQAAAIWQQCGSDGVMSKEWQKEKQLVDKIQPPSVGVSTSRSVGNNMEHLAICWLLSGEEKYYTLAKQWALEACSWSIWPDSSDLTGSHDIMGLATIYDIFYDRLTADELELIKNKLLLQAEYLYEGVLTLDSGIAQNHTLMKAIGLLTASLVLYDECPEMKHYIALAKQTIDQYLSLWGDDGAYFEGYGYWQYFLEYSFRYMDLSKKFFGNNLFEIPFFQKTSDYGMYMLLPHDSWTASNCIVDLADSDRSNWYGPSYLFRKLAKEYRNENAQWFAQEIRDSGIDALSSMWLGLLWYDPSVPATDPRKNMPTMKHFTDLDLISSRSDWSGKESQITFICGPAMGHNLNLLNQTDPYVDWGAGHKHNDSNHFTLFANGEWLIGDDGYAAVKYTSNHNTLLINGKGQLGEGGPWFDSTKEKRANIHIRKAESGADYDYFIGDATAAYPTEACLEKFDRHMIFLKPNVLIVVDHICTSKPKDMELRFFPEPQNGVIKKDGSFQAIGENSRLRIQSLTNCGMTLKSDMVLRPGRVVANAKPESVLLMSKKKATKWINVTAVSWSDKGSLPAVVYKQRDGNKFTFRYKGQTAVFDLDKETVHIIK